MISIAHLLLGALIGKSLNNVFVIALLSFVSHFILDALPHLDQGSFKKKDEFELRDWLLVILDLAIGISLVIYFALKFTFWNIVVGAFFAILPDLISGFAWFFNLNKSWIRTFNEIHTKIGFKMTSELVLLGIFLEIALIVAVLIVLFG